MLLPGHVDAGKAVLSEKDRRLLRFSLAFGLIFAFCQLLGARLDSAGTVQSGGLLLLAASLACAPAAGGLFLLLAKGTAGAAAASKEDASTPGRTFWMTFAALLLCWRPLSGPFSRYVQLRLAGEAAQFTTGQHNGAFPPLHTLLLAAFYRLGGAMGSYNAGIALYTAVQACTVAAALAYANAMLCRLGVKRGFRIGLAAAYGLLPDFRPPGDVSTTKDLFFCAALLPLLCLLAEGQREPKRLKKRGHAAGSRC